MHKHEGTFAEGQQRTEHHPERAGARGGFATGLEMLPNIHQGTFAEGQEHADPHPEVIENRLGFAAGQRTITFNPTFA